jgi:hypothetical protein
MNSTIMNNSVSGTSNMNMKASPHEQTNGRCKAIVCLGTNRNHYTLNPVYTNLEVYLNELGAF